MTDVNVEIAVEQAVTAVVIAAPKVQVVCCVFSELADAKEFYYFAPMEAKAGQYAAVYDQNNRGGEFPFKIVRIIRDNVIDVQNRANKSVWGSFDETFAKQVQERTERMARVRGQLDQKKKAFQEQEMFRMMATTDPEVAALLEELNGFGC
jgi:hypothetical protein